MFVEYRFFRMNPAGLIDAAERARFADDEDALAFARTFSDGASVEAWRGNLRIAKLPPQRASPKIAAYNPTPGAPSAATKWRRQSAR